jgi:lipopolysaccharide/colanic/teichoic acid biosynthesis glycosyltransferase
MKRVFDFFGSLAAVLLLSPVLVLLYFRIKREMGVPVLFHQTRPGLNGKPFQMIKFRTMKDEIDAQGNVLPDGDRITPLGQKLRSSSLDELPEFWNVLRGEMSMVGPRPLLMEYLPLYSERQARRHDVRPGVTGWAQINGRNSVSWKDKFELDVWYVENRSLWLDIKILWMTLKKVVKKDGISADGEATMSKFTGDE